jgi:UDP:flavonoid glycosyltransferase YjiC (YdhE family)
VSTAHALRAAGHEVLFVTAGTVERVADAGLHVADAAPGVDIGEIIRSLVTEHQGTFQRPGTDPEEHADFTFAAKLFARLTDVMADGTMHIAQWWRPDLVVHELLQGTGPLLAAKLGLPGVEYGISFAEGPELRACLAHELAAIYQRHGVSGAPRPARVLDVAPASMAIHATYGMPMRYVPYNGGGILPEWLLRPVERPRIAVTLGTVVPTFSGLTPLGRTLRCAADLDVEFVLAIGDADPSALGPLPPNVRAAGWIPLAALLSSCVAMIHHGGAGTTLTGLAAGISHLVLPNRADQFFNAEAVRRRGVGIVAEADSVDIGTLRALLEDERLPTAAAEVRAEITAMPTPADLVSPLLELVG